MPKTSENHVVIIPGKGDNIKFVEMATKNWSDFPFTTHIHSVDWQNDEDFSVKMARLTAYIDTLGRTGLTSLVGISAGGSCAFNAFIERKDTLDKAISICGRLRSGGVGLRSMETRTSGRPAFRESVLKFEQREKLLGIDDRKRLMTIRPTFGDELVPSESMMLEGAENRRVFSAGHLLSIYFVLRFPHQILSFLNYS